MSNKISNETKVKILKIASGKMLTDELIESLIMLEVGVAEDLILDVITDRLNKINKEEKQVKTAIEEKIEDDRKARKKDFSVELIHSDHPLAIDADIALLYINGKLHEPTARWIATVANSGGRKGRLGSTGTLLNMVTEIASFFRELGKIDRLWEYEDGDGSNLWKYATQFDMKHIRDTNLHQLPNKPKYKNKKILDNSMRIKMLYWLNYYHFQKSDGKQYVFVPTFSRESAKRQWNNNDSYLNFLDKKGSVKAAKTQWVNKWTIMPLAGPKKSTYHALSPSEFKHLRKNLRDQDLVFELIALLEVESGLRINASLEIDGNEFQSYFSYLNSGMELSNKIPMEFTNKGNQFRNIVTQAKVPLRYIQYLQNEYRADGNIYRKRKRFYVQGVRSGKFKGGYKGFWFLANGKPVIDQDVQNAFRKASMKMGRKINITPHWMRHTFATWIVMHYIKKLYGNNMAGTGIVPAHDIMNHLATLMFHISVETTRIYIATAYDQLKVADIDSATLAPVGLKTFESSPEIQKNVRNEAEKEFGKEFDEEKFDIKKYAVSRGHLRKEFFDCVA